MVSDLQPYHTPTHHDKKLCNNGGHDSRLVDPFCLILIFHTSFNSFKSSFSFFGLISLKTGRMCGLLMLKKVPKSGSRRRLLLVIYDFCLNTVKVIDNRQNTGIVILLNAAFM